MNDELRVKNNELGGKMNYRYRNDEEMKDSGVEWLDVIPKSWTRNKLKRELKFSVGSTPSTSNRSFFEGENIWVTIGDLNGKYCSESKTKLTEEALRSANMKKVPKGSLLYSFKLSVGQVAFTETDLYTNEAIASFYPNNNSNLDFWYYALGNYLIENSNENIYGAKLLNQELINNANIFVPSEEEQKKIAKFLDEKTAQFDSIISKKEALIEKLEEAKKSLISEVVTGKVKVVKTNDGYELVERKKEEMKDSGVEWIGDIPKNYKTIRLGLISFVTKLAGFEYTNNMASAISRLGEVPIVRAGNIKMNKFIDQDKEFIDIDTSKLLNRCALYQKCVLITFIGAGIGEVALFNKSKRYHLAPNVAKIEILRENKQKIDEQFLVYYLMSSAGQEEVNKIKKASAQPSLSMETIRSIKVVLPEWDEQEEITEYLGLKIEEMDKAENKILEQIKKLKEGKQSLISEAVTGKIEIL